MKNLSFKTKVFLIILIPALLVLFLLTRISGENNVLLVPMLMMLVAVFFLVWHILKDIEAQEIAVEKLRHSEQTLAEAQAIAHLGNWEFDIAKEELSFSDELFSILEWDKKDGPSLEDFLRITAPESLAMNIFYMNKALHCGVSYDIDHKVITRKGKEKYLHTITRSRYNARGERIKLYGICHDITVRKALEDELAQLLIHLENKIGKGTAELNITNETLREEVRERIKMGGLMQEKTRNLTESIQYAKRIQEAILPDKKKIKTALPDSFILYLPKDIVSGDFYWFHEKKESEKGGRGESENVPTLPLSHSHTFSPSHSLVYLAAVDCTGHGVPGAFMSLIGHELLNQVVIEKNEESPGKILTYMDEGINRQLRQELTSSEVMDGMDMTLVCIDSQNNRLVFAGANNPLYLVRNEKIGIMEVNNYPVGGRFFTDHVVFRESVIELQKGDKFYLASDGFASQFGGHSNKKFMKRHFYELLLSISHEPMSEQKAILHETFKTWSGDNEQVDDVLVIGFSV